jgi:hypothetical protein
MQRNKQCCGWGLPVSQSAPGSVGSHFVKMLRLLYHLANQNDGTDIGVI